MLRTARGPLERVAVFAEGDKAVGTEPHAT